LIRAYREEGFPITIVRPLLTYRDTQITFAVNSWTKSNTIVDRMRRGGRRVVAVGHHSEHRFREGAGRTARREQAIGHAFHITSDEVMTWDQWHSLTAEAAGAVPRLVHIPSDYCATVPYTHGARRTLEWFDADPSPREVDAEADAQWDRLIAAWERGTREALRVFRSNIS
jgi:hypothetical protein